MIGADDATDSVIPIIDHSRGYSLRKRSVLSASGMRLDQRLVNAATEFLNQRFPSKPWAGVAAMYTDCGTILISTAPDTVNSSVDLCHETGAICEAFKLGKSIVASVCISQDDKGNIHFLTPCGVCQERLFFWGDQIEVAVPDAGDSTHWQMKLLSELQPYYWRRPFLKN